MGTMNNRILLLLGLVIVASGCISQGSDSIEDVSSNPEAYMGEEVVLQGEVRGVGSGIQQVIESEQLEPSIPEETLDQVSTEKINARDHSGRIGNVDGEISFVGCEPSDYASEVKVRGTIKSYETCDCQTQEIDESLNGSREEIAEEFDQYEEPEDVELNYSEPSPKEDTFPPVCRQGINSSTTSVEIENTPIDLETNVEHKSCIEDTREKHYYFSCQEIVEEYE